MVYRTLLLSPASWRPTSLHQVDDTFALESRNFSIRSESISISM